MKYSLIAVSALIATTSAIQLEEKNTEAQLWLYPNGDVVNLDENGCDDGLEISEAQLYIELDYFSRKFDRKNYDNAMKIYDELKKLGKNPKLFVNTWELYDAAFSFPRVRRYDLVQQHMDLIQHFEDNLNQNMSNGQLVSNFIKVCKDAQTAFNAKYHDGEFDDPAGFDPQEEHKTTWSNVKL